MSKVERDSNIRSHNAVLGYLPGSRQDAFDYCPVETSSSPKLQTPTPETPDCRRWSTKHGPPTDAGAGSRTASPRLPKRPQLVAYAGSPGVRRQIGERLPVLSLSS